MVLLRKTLLILSLFALAACGSLSDDGGTSSFNPVAETSYCSTVQTHSPAITVQSTAQFRKRTVVPGLGLAGVSAALPIRYAEVQVVNSAGKTVQCGETSNAGAVSVTIPKTAGTYTLKVLSRADNSRYKTSILNNPSYNVPYSISVSFTVTGSESSPVAVTLPVAAHNGDVKGGAFNILDLVYQANEYLRTNSGNATIVAPKVRIYWTAGLSPGLYAYNDPTEPVSFFSDTDSYPHGILKGMYILGGIKGDVNCTDTDHFDDSVILHEYGHFLESVYSGSDSPGGKHDGNRLIDPRLAWSEGWANFIQAAMLGQSYYRDTIGNNSCSGSWGFGVNLNLETPQADQDQMGPGTPDGQGVFREVSVSRTLYDILDTTLGGDSKGADIDFSYVWRVFANPPPEGMSGGTVNFRNMGMFNQKFYDLIDAEDNSKIAALTDVLENEFQVTSAGVSALDREYAYKVTAQTASSCPLFEIEGVLTTEGGVTNFLENDDFFAYYYDGNSANATITLRYAATPSGVPDDLDLYIYYKNHVYGSTSTMAAKSARYYPEQSGTGVEAASLAGKPAGWYLINVKSDIDNLGVKAAYRLETNSGANWLCPAP